MATPTLHSFRPTPRHRVSFWSSIGIEDSKMGKTEAVHQGFRVNVYRNIIERTQLSQAEFQQVTHIPISTLKRRLKNNERFNTQESDAMYRLAMLIQLATDLFNDEQQALAWMRDPVYGLGGKRPLDMVSTSVDFEMVKDLIGRIEHGVFA